MPRLIKEHPKTEQELATSVGYAVAEKKVVKVAMITTVSVLRAQPYSIE